VRVSQCGSCPGVGKQTSLRTVRKNGGLKLDPPGYRFKPDGRKDTFY